jgi:RimJ/RimL family protein N-acetyltransferase
MSVALREILQDDCERVLEILREPDIYVTLGLKLEEVTEQFVVSLVERSQSLLDPLTVVGIFLDGTLVGLVDTNMHANNSIELGYLVASAYRGRGIATEAVKLMLESIPSSIERILADVIKSNEPSVRILKSFGFKPIRVSALDGVEYLTMECIH